MIPPYDVPMPPPSVAIITPQGNFTPQIGRILINALWGRTGEGSGIPIKVAVDLIAVGTVQSDALGLLVDWNEVDTVVSGAGVILFAIKAGQTQGVYNGGANALLVYPATDCEIDSLGANAPYSLAAGKMQFFQAWSNTQIRTMQLG